MSLRDEVTGAQRVPRGYTLLAPPDWGRFSADDAGRDEFISLLRARFLQVGRPDLYAEIASGVRRQWTQMRARAAIEIFMPITPSVEGAVPMSLLTSPWLATGEFLADLQERARSSSPIEELDTGDGGMLYRWEHERRAGADMGDVQTREINYVRPFPGDAPQRGILIMVSIVHPGIDDAGTALDAFTALADSIVSTLRWRFV